MTGTYIRHYSRIMIIPFVLLLTLTSVTATLQPCSTERSFLAPVTVGASEMVDKLKSVSDVVQSIPSGSHLALGGFAIARNLIAVVHELIRQQKRDLTVSQGVVGLDTDLLVGAGLVKHLMMGGGSLDRFGPVPATSARCFTWTASMECEFSSVRCWRLAFRSTRFE